MALSDIDFGSRPGDTVVDLSGEISDGDNLDDIVNPDSGEQVYVPPGTYETEFGFVDGSFEDCTVIGDPEGVTAVRPDHEELNAGCSASGDVLFENFTIEGEAGSIKSRISAGGGDGDTLTFRNWNMPDGTVSYSDAYAFNDGNNDGGELIFEKCFFANFGNSTTYVSQGSGDVTYLGTTIINGNTAIRAPAGNLTVIGCQFLWTGEPSVGCWDYNESSLVSQDPDDYGGCGLTSRGIRNKDVAQEQYVVKDTDFYVMSDYGGDGGSAAIQLREGNVMDGGEVTNCRFRDEVGDQMAIEVRDDGYYDVLDASNLHLSAGAEIDSGFEDAVVGSEQPNGGYTIWTPGKWQGERAGGGDDSVGGGDGDTGVTDGDLLVMHAPEGANPDANTINYSFTVEGEISRVTEWLESADTVTDNGDGTMTATGTTSAPWRDAWVYNGTVTAMSWTSGYTLNLYLNPSSIESPASSTQTTMDELVSEPSDGGDDGTTQYDNHLYYQTLPDAPGTDISFEFTGDAARGPESESSDTITTLDNGNTLVTSSNLGNGAADDWNFNGSIVAVDAPVDYQFQTVTVNGEDRTSQYNGSLAGDEDTEAPSVSVSVSPATIVVGEAATFTADASDNVGVESIEWSNGDTGSSTTISPSQAGVVSLTATVMDAAGNSATDTASLTVEADTQDPTDTTPPTVNVSADFSQITVGDSVTFTASAADNVGVDRIEWSNGDVGPSTTVTPSTTGTYSLSATATDSAGNSASDSASVSVVPADDGDDGQDGGGPGVSSGVGTALLLAGVAWASDALSR